MKRLLYLFSLLILLSCSEESDITVNNQTDSPERYNQQIFTNITITQNVQYGTNITLAGINVDLFMDIYEPENDTEINRPLIVLAHGGSFTSGDKTGLDEFASFLAKSGYVVASINYRLLDINYSELALKQAVVNAISDMKAAVRFFKKDNITTDSYKIDPSNIFIGGASAGAITALHYAYLNSDTELITIGGNNFLDYVNSHGGLDGNSGNANYSSDIKGIINISGGLFKATFVNAGEPILFSVHGTSDPIVPYNQGAVNFSNVIIEGSGLIHPVATSVGIQNQLITIENGGHNAFLTCSECQSETRAFIFLNL
ncbi:MAG: alpha/beta hydrolase [Flavobacteriaceae bacterium]|nr:alpha/beta hydrolase [Flavobacteriaceae bacterium]